MHDVRSDFNEDRAEAGHQNAEFRSGWRAIDCGSVLASDPIEVAEADGDEGSNDDAHVNPGWEPGPWADRLDYLAGLCEKLNPNLAADHRRRAAAIRRKHDLSAGEAPADADDAIEAGEVRP